MRIGFAGLGRMGQCMARNLIGAGHDVRVWNRTAQTSRDFAAAESCIVALTPADLVGQTDIVVTMLADDAASDAVHFGVDGLFAVKGATVIVEMGTMSPDHIAKLSNNAPEGVRVIDAPVSGATQAAADADLLVMAGCEKGDANLTAVFGAIARETIYLGQAGSGSVMKLAVNSLIHGINQTLAEALTLAESSGIAAETAFDVIEASAACAPMLKYRRPLYLNEPAHDVTFTVSLARKDMEVTARLAERLGTAMPQGRTTLAKLIEAEAAGYGARDMASMLDYMRRDTQ
ncbi:3-hydroxyisobutyrate dehydrogenase [Loktanella sp. DSM 29012]|uniref:NAD(P)-dependent oxidoreductase n=1 Tax=Loktanella sp. DSM 29012 TaxID=1881056 RepID=UPI0008B06B12|nr:NAD(P)-dependent oxidoreductase [Loktanella sp. DSM 29012]SEQ86190.1 3-hydroxyisobutyrate dehydrogenase [Loktanella sp. DSM 29012]